MGNIGEDEDIGDGVEGGGVCMVVGDCWVEGGVVVGGDDVGGGGDSVL